MLGKISPKNGCHYFLFQVSGAGVPFTKKELETSCAQRNENWKYYLLKDILKQLLLALPYSSPAVLGGAGRPCRCWWDRCACASGCATNVNVTTYTIHMCMFKLLSLSTEILHSDVLKSMYWKRHPVAVKSRNIESASACACASMFMSVYVQVLCMWESVCNRNTNCHHHALANSYLRDVHVFTQLWWRAKFMMAGQIHDGGANSWILCCLEIL